MKKKKEEWFVWITVEGRIIRRLVVYDNSTFKKLFKVEEDQIFR